MTFSLARNLLEGWPTEGACWSKAARRINPTEWERIKSTFDPKKQNEVAAALFAYAFTGLIPTNEDDQSGGGGGRDGAVDIRLADGATGEVQIMEVTSSIYSRYQCSSSALGTFESRVSSGYTGDLSWCVELEHGWENLDLCIVAQAIVAALNSSPAETLESPCRQQVHSHAVIWRSPVPTIPKVQVISRNAGASPLDRPYLEALSEYLRNDPVMTRKLDKLTQERANLGATRSHLFIGMASTGIHGGLLPISPSYFTWGHFSPLDGLDDLWLHGGTGELFHWAREDGWVFHNLRA